MWVLLAAVAVTMLLAATARAASCGSSTTVGLDTSYVNDAGDVSLGHATGQTFLAPETEILSITVWRAAFWDTNYFVWHIFIMGIDSLGYPDVHNIIQDGPTLQIPYGDGVHPTPFRFVFDPPVSLPAPGTYEFAIQGDSCQGIFDLADDHNDDYPDGILWDHARQATYCLYRPSGNATPYPSGDLVFEVEFCRPDTRSLPTSWGGIKAMYR